MKKNKMMRLASGLLVAVLITTSTISGTFAKYVTEDSATDSARVAKFGVVVTAEGSLFEDEYENAGSEVTVRTSGAVGDNVVAPGTQNVGDGMKFSISGDPEVAVKISVTVENAKDIYLSAGTYPDMTTGDSGATDKFTVPTEGYYPVKYTLWKDGAVYETTPGDPTTKVEDVNMAALETALTGLANPATVIAPETVKLGGIEGNYKITWEWDFGAAGDPITFEDKADTLLGDLAAGLTTEIAAKATATGATNPATPANYALETGFDLTIRVEQVD